MFQNLGLEEATGRLISILEKNISIISILIKNHLEIMLLEYTGYVVDGLFHVRQKSKTTPYMMALVSGAIVNTVVFWVREGRTITSLELNSVIQEFLCRAYSTTL